MNQPQPDVDIFVAMFFFEKQFFEQTSKCAMVKSRYIGDGHPTFNRNPYNWYKKPYYWVDDHPLLYGNIGSLDNGTSEYLSDSEINALKREDEQKIRPPALHA